MATSTSSRFLGAQASRTSNASSRYSSMFSAIQLTTTWNNLLLASRNCAQDVLFSGDFLSDDSHKFFMTVHAKLQFWFCVTHKSTTCAKVFRRGVILNSM